MKKIILSCLSLCLFCASLHAQVTVTSVNGSNMADVIRQYFVTDESVELDMSAGHEPKFNGQSVINSNQVGTFTNGDISGTNMPLSSGIVMVTGNCQDAAAGVSSSIEGSSAVPAADNGPNYSPSLYRVYTSNGGTNTMNDIACMTLWVIPKSERMSFSYSFASEEYPSFVCSSFNDTFGLFISGPYDENGNLITQSGDYYQDENIALIPPDYTTPVMINTINGGTAHGSTPPCILTNTAYFRENNNNNCKMNGYTVDLQTKKVEVMPCYRYKIEIALCDIGDHSYNSAIYLKANSLHADAVLLNHTDDGTAQRTDEGYLVFTKGCSSDKISIGANYEVTNNINYSVEVVPSQGSNLTEGVDYVFRDDEGNEVGSTLRIIRGGNEAHVNLHFLHNEAKAPLTQDTLYLISEFVNDCTPRDTIKLILKEPDVMTYNVLGGKTYCDNELPLTETITVSSEGGYQYMKVHISNSLGEPAYDTIARYVEGESEIVVNYHPVIHEPVTFTIDIEDSCGRSFTTTVDYLIQGATTQASIDKAMICEGEQITLSCPETAEYNWTSVPSDASLVGHQTEREPVLTPAENTEYTVTITDENGCIASSSIGVVVVPNVNARISLSTRTLTISSATLNYEDLTIGAVDRFWDLGDGNTSTAVSGAETYPTVDTGTYQITLIAYNSAGCPDTAFDYVQVVPDFTFYLPNAFMPGSDDEKVSVFRPVGAMLEYFRIDIFNRWGARVFEGVPNQGWDGTVDGGDIIEQGMYIYDIFYKDGNGLEQRVTGEVMVLPRR